MEIPANGAAITKEWLERALALGNTAGGGPGTPKIASAQGSAIAGGVGLMGEITRFVLTYESGDAAAPASVVVKLGSPEPANLAIAKAFFLHAREHGFYQHLAARVPVRVPRLYYGDFDEASHGVVLVLEDLSHLEAPDQVAGADAAQARSAIREAARLHAAYWGRVDEGPMTAFADAAEPTGRHAAQMGFAASIAPACERFAAAVSPQARRKAEAFAPKVAAHLATVARAARTFVHGDFRLDNMLFSGGRPTLVDWQLSGRGGALYDVGYFLAGSVSTAVRREIEREVLEEYHGILCAQGVAHYGFEQCWQDYRGGVLASLLVPVIVCGSLDLTTERGRRLAQAGLSRHFAAVEDLQAAALLPA